MDIELTFVKTLLKLVQDMTITPGQYIYCTDSNRAFYDLSNNSRIEVDFALSDELVPDNITDRVLNRVYYLEPVHRFYVYEITGFRRLFTSDDADQVYGAYGLVPFTMQQQITGQYLAPRTLASCVYTKDGSSIESIIENSYRMGNRINLYQIPYNGSTVIPIPFPFEDYFNGGNLLHIYYNGVRMNLNSDYFITDDENLVFMDASAVRKDDVVTFDFIYNASNVSSSEKFQTVIEGGYITKQSIPTNRLAKTSDTYMENDPSSVATAAAVNAAYVNLNNKINAIADQYKGSYTTEAGGTASLVTVIIPDIDLKDGTEINIKLTNDLNNNALLRLNALPDCIIYVNGTRTTSIYKAGDFITLVYSLAQNAYNVKMYCDYKITTHYYSVRTDENWNIIPFYIPQYLPGITTLKVYQNNLRLFDDINYVVHDNTIRLLDYVTNDGDIFVFEVDVVDKYYL